MNSLPQNVMSKQVSMHSQAFTGTSAVQVNLTFYCSLTPELHFPPSWTCNGSALPNENE